MSKYRPRLNGDGWADLIELGKTHTPAQLIEVFTNWKQSVETDAQVIEISDTQAKTLDQLLSKYRIPKDVWEIEKSSVNDWVTWMKEDGKPVAKVNYQIKAQLKRRTIDLPSSDAFFEKWLDKFESKIELEAIASTQDPNKPIVLALADLHIGALENNVLVPDYNPEVAHTRLMEIAGIVNKFDRPVHVFLLGDLIESFSGMNHKDSWKHLATYGVDTALQAFDFLYDFFKAINKLSSVYLISGNHDRVSADKEEDPEGQVVKLVYGMFARVCPELKMFYHPFILNPTIDGVTYIGTHGDKRITKMAPEEMVLNFGNQHGFNVILSGHYHERKLTKDALKFRNYVVPPVYSGGNYSESSGYFSTPGCLVFEQNTPAVNVHDYTFK